METTNYPNEFHGFARFHPEAQNNQKAWPWNRLPGGSAGLTNNSWSLTMGKLGFSSFIMPTLW